MRAQTEAAIGSADVILFMIDARAGITPDDRAFANLLRRADKPLILLANKAEGAAGSAGAMEAFDLGLGEPVTISAEHGEGLLDLRDALVAALPILAEHEDEDVADEVKTFGEDEDGTNSTSPSRCASPSSAVPMPANRLCSIAFLAKTVC